MRSPHLILFVQDGGRLHFRPTSQTPFSLPVLVLDCPLPMQRPEMHGHARKHSETAGNTWKRAETPRNGWKRPETGGNGSKRTKTGGNGWKRPETGGNGWKRPETGGNGGNTQKWAETVNKPHTPFFPTV